MVFVEVLKQSDSISSNRLGPDSKGPTEDLIKAIPRFFSKRAANIHAVIVCSDCENEPISKEQFQQALSKNNGPCNDLPKRLPFISTFIRKRKQIQYYVYSAEKLRSVGSAINTILERVHFCYDHKDIADSLACQIIGEEKDNIDWKDIWTEQLARMLFREVRSMTNSARKASSLNSLFLLLCLPEKYFEVFKYSEFFPSYIEYVVRGVDAGNYEEINRANLRAKIEEKNKILNQSAAAPMNAIITAEKMRNDIVSSFGKDDIQDMENINLFAAVVDLISNMKIHDYDSEIRPILLSILYDIIKGDEMNEDLQQKKRNRRVLTKSQHPPAPHE